MLRRLLSLEYCLFSSGSGVSVCVFMCVCQVIDRRVDLRMSEGSQEGFSAEVRHDFA